MGKGIDGTLTDEEEEEIIRAFKPAFEAQMRSLRFWFVVKFVAFVIIMLGLALALDGAL